MSIYLNFFFIFCMLAFIFYDFWIVASTVPLQLLLHNGSYTFAYFFWILSNIKMKFGEILVYLIINMSNLCLGQCWRLKTSSRSCYSFNEMTIWRDLTIFSSLYYPFLIFLYLNFQKIETLETLNNWLLSNWSRLLH